MIAARRFAPDQRPRWTRRCRVATSAELYRPGLAPTVLSSAPIPSPSVASTSSVVLRAGAHGSSGRSSSSDARLSGGSSTGSVFSAGGRLPRPPRRSDRPSDRSSRSSAEGDGNMAVISEGLTVVTSPLSRATRTV